MYPLGFLFTLCRAHEGQRHVLAVSADVEVVLQVTAAATMPDKSFGFLVRDVDAYLLAVYELLHIPP